jgi:acetolactate synthase-1/2/3 large subunit
MAEMTGAQALIRALRAQGVDTIFALPGAQIMAAFDALYDYRDEINLVQTRHEQATTYMADGYAKATGKVGVAMVVPGPGATNAMAGLGTAYASSSPVLMISGQVMSTGIGKNLGQLHEVHEQLDMFRPITKWNHRAMHVEEIPEAVHEAFHQLKSGRPRPVELEIPPDTLASSGNVEIIEPEEYPRHAPEADRIEAAASVLADTAKPCIIAGGGALISDCGAELLELAEMLQAPIVLTPEGKGAIPGAHPLVVGAHYGGVGPVEAVLGGSDALLAVGTRLFFRNLSLDHLKIVQVDVDSEEIGKAQPVAVGVEADAKLALRAIVDRLRAQGVRKPSRAEEIERYRSDFDGFIRGIAPDQMGFVDAIRAELGDEDIVVSGVTTIGYWSNVAYEARKPRTFLTSSYFGTLGYAFPTALGAKVGRPDRNVVAISGDGGFMYNPQELSTAVKYGINAVCVVFNNGVFGASEWDQKTRYNQRFIGTDLLNPDFVKMTEAFGAVGMRTDADGFGPALRKALDTEAPVVLDVSVPNMQPPFQVRR